eukprot:1159118-Pelagomonas_calceolata.AAC.12
MPSGKHGPQPRCAVLKLQKHQASSQSYLAARHRLLTLGVGAEPGGAESGGALICIDLHSAEPVVTLCVDPHALRPPQACPLRLRVLFAAQKLAVLPIAGTGGDAVRMHSPDML